MSDEQDQIRLMAERIARRVSQSVGGQKPESEGDAGEVGGELAAVRSTLAELQKRVAEVESHFPRRERESPRTSADVSADQSSEPARQGGAERPTQAPWLSGMYVPAAHPSQERFGVEEAAVSELVEFFETEKTCSLEPGGKPCDHCAMCNTRGF
ncbi:MAG TPA: hypothetical protein VF507_08660 [Pyrinomonadaceae bacterium]